MQGKVLGMVVGIFGKAGKDRDISETGQPGKLVCTRPHLSLPMCFWGDNARGTKSLNACYNTYPGMWCHGDFIAMIPHTKGYIILGHRSALPCYPSCVCSDRHSHLCTSDGVLNPSGVRFGSGEICGVLERPEFSTRIDDAICVGQRRPQDKDERVLLFIKMRAGQKLDPQFEEAIRAAIRSALSRRHVP